MTILVIFYLSNLEQAITTFVSTAVIIPRASPAAIGHRYLANPLLLRFLVCRAEFGHREGPKALRKGKPVWCATDDSSSSHPGFSHHVAHEIEIYCIADIRQFRPLRFQQFQASAGVHHKVQLAGSV